MKRTATRHGYRQASAAATTLLAIVCALAATAETCTTQSQMKPEDRNALVAAVSTLAAKVQAGDAPGLRGLSVAELSKDFANISEVVGNMVPRLKGGSLAIDQVYLLDASTLKRAADGSATDAQFYCTLNRSANEADFLIPALPPGRYAFAIVASQGSSAPWRLSFLLRREGQSWLMAGFYPKPLTAAGHDGLWYWTEARKMAAGKEPWNAWLYLQEAADLLQPAGFAQSTHLEKLRTETISAAPPALSEGVTPDAPLVVKAKDGTEFRFVSLGVDDSLNAPSLDLAVHLKVDGIDNQAATRQRNIAAMSALLAAHPELRKPFHGIWVFADAPGQPTYATEQVISDIP